MDGWCQLSSSRCCRESYIPDTESGSENAGPDEEHANLNLDLNSIESLTLYTKSQGSNCRLALPICYTTIPKNVKLFQYNAIMLFNLWGEGSLSKAFVRFNTSANEHYAETMFIARAIEHITGFMYITASNEHKAGLMYIKPEQCSLGELLNIKRK